MDPKRCSLLALALCIGLAACSDKQSEAGGEAGTPAQSIPESEPEGVGGTSNQ